MGWITMSERDLQRIEVLTDALAGRRTVAKAGTVLALSERQMYRLLAKYEAGGGAALIHKPALALTMKQMLRREPEGNWLETIIPFLNAFLRKRLKILRVIPPKVSMELPDI